MKIILILFVLLFSSSVFAKDMASWGYTGFTCKNFVDAVELLGEDIGKDLIQAYLTGYNVAQFYIDDAKAKILNFNSTDFALSFVLEGCKKAGSDEYFFIVINDYWDSLPYFK